MRPHAIHFDQALGRTRQEFKRECDINQIMARATRDGVISHLHSKRPEYGDFESFDFQEAQNMTAQAHALFMELPAAARKHFDNDAGKFLDYVNGNPDEALLAELGLTNSRGVESLRPSSDPGPAEPAPPAPDSDQNP